MTPRPQRMPIRPSTPSEGAGDLARLLDTEARLEETLRRARDEGAGMIAAARAAAAARDAALTSDLEALGRTLETSIAEERRRQEATLAESARQDARAFDEAGPERIEALARYVVERVIGAEP